MQLHGDLYLYHEHECSAVDGRHVLCVTDGHKSKSKSNLSSESIFLVLSYLLLDLSNSLIAAPICSWFEMFYIHLSHTLSLSLILSQVATRESTPHGALFPMRK
jgi:hypothetical protein